MRYLNPWPLAALALSFTAGCATSTGTKPHDMSIEQHEAAATREEQAAAQHAGHFDPAAKSVKQTCGRAVCWTTDSNPTAEHRADADAHKKLAAEHRAAAQALRDAESSACAGIDEDDLATSPFYHRDDITSVTEAQRSAVHARHEQNVPSGGRVVFRAVPGMTAEWLQRLVNCHLARAAAAGYSMPEMSYCPLMLKGANATVTSTGDGFAVDITSNDSATAAEIWRRVQALKP
jgi:hypothetical protein